MIQFPDPSTASEEGIVGVGGSLSVINLYNAYSNGIFPWPHEGYPLLWFSPWERGVLDFNELHISRSLKKWDQKVRKQNLWTYTVNQAFSEVIRACSDVPRPHQSGTWITSEMISAYEEFHKSGHVLSLEVWEAPLGSSKNEEELILIGGIYGVYVNNVFSAESMFYRRSNASKWAFWQLVKYLQSQGLRWMDVQMVTEVTESFGAKLIPQEDFLKRLKSSSSV